MILFREKEVAIITPPKNASSALYDQLCNPQAGGVEVLGAMPGPQPLDIEAHSTIIPRRFNHFRKVVVVRDPYDRAESLWRHEVDRGHPPKNRFDEWCRDRLIESYSWWYQPTSDYCPKAGEGFQIVMVENLVDGIKEAIGVTISGERVNQGGSIRPPAEELKAAEEIINFWAEADFANFGYNRRGVEPSAVNI